LRLHINMVETQKQSKNIAIFHASKVKEAKELNVGLL